MNRLGKINELLNEATKLSMEYVKNGSTNLKVHELFYNVDYDGEMKWIIDNYLNIRHHDWFEYLCENDLTVKHIGTTSSFFIVPDAMYQDIVDPQDYTRYPLDFEELKSDVLDVIHDNAAISYDGNSYDGLFALVEYLRDGDLIRLMDALAEDCEVIVGYGEDVFDTCEQMIDDISRAIEAYKVLDDFKANVVSDFYEYLDGYLDCCC